MTRTLMRQVVPASPVLIAALAGLLIPVLHVTPTVVAALVIAVALALAVAHADVERRASLALVTCVAAALLIPPLRGGRNGGTPILAADLLIVFIASTLAVRGTGLRLGRVQWMLVALAAFIATSLLGSSLSGDAGASWRDLWIFVRLAKYAAVPLIGYELGRRLGWRRERFWILLLIPFGVGALAGIAQYYSLFGVNSWLSGRYGGNSALLATGADFRRAFGTVGNSNYFGFLCAVALVIGIWIWLTQSRQSARLVVAVMTPALALALFVSGSRAALLAFVASAFCLLVASLFGRAFWRRALVVAALLVAASPVALSAVSSLPIAKRYFFIWGGADPASRVSIEQRKEVWRGTLALLRGHWVFGIGPDKGVLVQWVDNDFLRMLREFGLVGAVPAFLCLIAVTVSFARRLPSSRVEEGAAALLGFSLMVGLVVFGLTADVLYQDQVMTVVLLLLGVLGAARASHDGVTS